MKKVSLIILGILVLALGVLGILPSLGVLLVLDLGIGLAIGEIVLGAAAIIIALIKEK